MLKREFLAAVTAVFTVDEIKHLEHAPPASPRLHIVEITKDAAVVEPGDRPEYGDERELQRAKVANVCRGKSSFLNYPKTPSLSAVHSCDQIQSDTYLNHGKESRYCTAPESRLVCHTCCEYLKSPVLLSLTVAANVL